MIEYKKVAIVLSGHLRTYDRMFPYLKSNILDLYDCDIYVSTWNNLDPNSENYLSVDEIYSKLSIYHPWLKKTLIHEARESYQINMDKIRKLGHEYGTWKTSEYKPYIGGLMSEDAINKVTIQWFAVAEGFRLIDNPEKYNVLMRDRFDIKHILPMLFLDSELVAGNAYGVESYYNIRDYFVYGKPSILPIMTSIHDRSIEVLIKYNNFSAETMLEYCLRNNEFNIPLTIDNHLRCNIEYTLVKS